VLFSGLPLGGMSCNGSVIVMTRLKARQLRNHGSIPGSEKRLFVSRMVPRPTQSYVQWVLGAFSPGTKRLGHEADISPSSSVKIMNMLNHMTSIPDNLWKPSHSNWKFTCMCCWHLTCGARQDLELCPLPCACLWGEGRRKGGVMALWFFIYWSYTSCAGIVKYRPPFTTELACCLCQDSSSYIVMYVTIF